MTTLAASGLLAPETAEAIRVGLSTRPLRLPFECFYDDVGSALFEAITLLPEYGISRAERRVLPVGEWTDSTWPFSLSLIAAA